MRVLIRKAKNDGESFLWIEMLNDDDYPNSSENIFEMPFEAIKTMCDTFVKTYTCDDVIAEFFVRLSDEDETIYICSNKDAA